MSARPEPVEEERMLPLTYRGKRRDGSVVVGRDSADPAIFTERLYREGFQRLTVEANGCEVAGINRHPDSGERVWWSE